MSIYLFGLTQNFTKILKRVDPRKTRQVNARSRDEDHEDSSHLFLFFLIPRRRRRRLPLDRFLLKNHKVCLMVTVLHFASRLD